MYIAKLSLNDIKVIRYNKEHRGDVCSVSKNQITLTIAGELGPNKEVNVGGNMTVKFADPANANGLLYGRNVAETTTFDLVPHSVSYAAADRNVRAGLVPADGDATDIDHWCVEDQFISYAYYKGEFTGDVVLQRKDTNTHCSQCKAAVLSAGEPAPAGHVGDTGETEPHPNHDEDWSKCEHCSHNCARATLVMLGKAQTQDSVMRDGTDTLAGNHEVGITGPDLEANWELVEKGAVEFLKCYKGIREENALGSRPMIVGETSHAHLVNGARKNDKDGNITGIKYHAADPWDGDIEWRPDFTEIYLQ